MRPPRKSTKASTLSELLSEGAGKSVQELAAAAKDAPKAKVVKARAVA